MLIMNFQFCNIMFMLNNFVVEFYFGFFLWKFDIVLFVIYQLECGEQNGMLYFQGYIELKCKMCLLILVVYYFFLCGVYFEKCMGIQVQVVVYCNKEVMCEFNGGFWIFGEVFNDECGICNDLYGVKDVMKEGMCLDDVYDYYFDIVVKYFCFVEYWICCYIEFKIKCFLDIEFCNEFQIVFLDCLEEELYECYILWFFDFCGGVGKIFMVKYMVDSMGVFYINGGKQVDIIYVYKGQCVVVFDFVWDFVKYVNYGVIE